MNNYEKGILATSTTRFFTLLLFAAGVIAGMGSYLMLNGSIFNIRLVIGNTNFTSAGLALLLVIFLVVITSIWGIWVFRKESDSRVSNIAKFFTMLTFVTGIIFGMGISILTGILTGVGGAIGVVILLFVIILIYGIWLFRPKEA